MQSELVFLTPQNTVNTATNITPKFSHEDFKKKHVSQYIVKAAQMIIYIAAHNLRFNYLLMSTISFLSLNVIFFIAGAFKIAVSVGLSVPATSSTFFPVARSVCIFDPPKTSNCANLASSHVETLQCSTFSFSTSAQWRRQWFHLGLTPKAFLEVDKFQHCHNDWFVENSYCFLTESCV